MSLVMILSDLRAGVFPPRHVLVSYPKSGRTWCRMLIGTCAEHLRGSPLEDPTDLKKAADTLPDFPQVHVTHDVNPHLKKPAQIRLRARRYRQSNVIFLTRDPRDVLVSLFLSQKFRRRSENGPMLRFESIEELCRSERGGLKSLIKFYNEWADADLHGVNVKFLSYEDLKTDTQSALQKMMRFYGYDASKGMISFAVERSAFDEMQHIERSQSIKAFRMRPADLNNIESFKVRRGMVGGYKDYMSDELQILVNNEIQQRLHTRFSQYYTSD